MPRAGLAVVLALALGPMPATASSTAFFGMHAPVAAWLARAPAACEADLIPLDHVAAAGHVAYFVGSAMDGDEKNFYAHFDPAGASQRGAAGGNWSSGPGASILEAEYDAHRRVAAYSLGKEPSQEGVFAEQSPPPAGAPPMSADFSDITLGGNVHLGDSLAAVSRALGVASLAPTVFPACAGLGTVELCSWNRTGCSCPPSLEEWVRLRKGGAAVSGTIVFRDSRVVGLIWSGKCWQFG